MIEYRTVEARPYHLTRIVRRIRAEDASAAEALGIDARSELQRIFDASPYRRAWLVDGAVTAVGGVTGTAASSTGVLWLVTSRDLGRHARQFFSVGIDNLRAILETRSHVDAVMLRSDDAARRFATHFGFRLRHPQSYSDLLRMELRRELPQRPQRSDHAPRPFIVYGMPRSRTAWMANFLTYGGWQCGHDEATYMRGVADIDRYFARARTGASETGAAPGWRVLHDRVPHLRFAVVRRPVDDVIESLRKVPGVTFDMDRIAAIIRYEARCLDQIATQRRALVLNYADLDTRAGVTALFEHSLPYRFDPLWWSATRSQNIQIDFADLVRYRQANRKGMDGFKGACWSALRRLASEQREVRRWA